MEILNPSTLAITPSGTFALRPAAALGGYYFATDLGNYGALLHSNGTNWTPVGGSAVLYQSGVATPTTNSATETNLAVAAIPAGLLTSKGRLDFEGIVNITGTTNTKNAVIRISSISGDPSSGPVPVFLVAAAGNVGGAFMRHLWAANSTSAQITEPITLAGPGFLNSTGTTTFSLDTTTAWYVNFNGKTTSASDTIGYQGLTVRWVE